MSEKSQEEKDAEGFHRRAVLVLAEEMRETKARFEQACLILIALAQSIGETIAF